MDAATVQHYESIGLGQLLKIAIVISFLLFRGVSLPWVESNYSIVTIGFVLIMLVLGIKRIPPLLLAQVRQFHLPFYVPYMYLLALLSVVGLIVAALFGSMRLALPVFLEFIAAIVLAHMIFLSFRTPQEIKWLLRGFAFAGISISFYFFGLYLVAENALKLMRLGAIGAEGATYNTVAYNLAVAFWVGPGAAVAIRQRKGFLDIVLLAFPAMAIIAIGIFLTGTRGGVLALACVIGLACIIGQKSKTELSPAVVLLPILMLFAIVIVPLVVHESASTERILTFFSDDRVASQGFLAIRGELWSQAWRQIVSEPEIALFGLGFGQPWWPYEYNKYIYAHNLFLELAINAGIPAAAVLGMLLWRAWKLLMGIIGHKAESPLLRLLAAQILGLGVVAFVGGSISFKMASNVLLWIFFGLAARLVVLNKQCAKVSLSRQSAKT